MKVEVETKITVLDGEKAGRVFTQKTIGNTITEHTEFGIIERLRLEWCYLTEAQLQTNETLQTHSVECRHII